MLTGANLPTRVLTKDPDLGTSEEPPTDRGVAGIDIVVVSHRTPDLVMDCVDAALAAHPGRVVVVDNASADGTVDQVCGAFPDVDVLANERNVGFGTAVNQGIASTSAPYVLVLNGDTTIEPALLDALVRHLDERPGVGLVGPVLRRTDGSLQHSTFHFPSFVDSVVAETGLQLLVLRIPGLRERFLRTWSHDRIRRVDWVVGAAFAVRRTAFDAVDGFDEDFFMYSEEVDLCRRLADAGHVVEFAPLGVVTHVGEASARQAAEEMERERQRSAVRYLRKHETPRRAVRLLRFLRAVTALRAGRDLAFGLLGTRHERSRRRHEARARWRQVLDPDLWKP